MYYPQNRYLWEYQGKRYESWFEIEHLFGNDAVQQAQRINMPPDWRPNTPFRAVLTVKDFSRGRSAANFDLEDRNGVPYTMFLKDFLELVQTTKIDAGKTEPLMWCFCKRGQNYGIQLAHGKNRSNRTQA